MARDESAFSDFVQARSTALLRTAYLLTGDRGLAEDLLQTALAKTYVAWERIRDPEAVESYVRRILVTTATSWWRRKAWQAERPTGVTFDRAVNSEADQIDERDRVWSAVKCLPAGQRAVVVLRFYEDQSEAEIARLLGCSTGTVKSQCAKAMTKLRTQFGDDTVRSTAGEGME